MKILNLPYLNSSYIMACAIIEVLNLKPYSGRYHKTNDGAFAIITMPSDIRAFVKVAEKAMRAEYKNQELDEHFSNSDLAELQKLASFLEEVEEFEYKEFAIEAL